LTVSLLDYYKGLHLFSLLINNNISSAFLPKSVISNIKGMNIVVAINPGASDAKSQNPYNVSQLTLPLGSNITWINNDGSAILPHRIISGTPDKGPSNLFYSPNIKVGENFTFAFNKPGIYPYYDRNYEHMTGQLIVKVLNNTR
jgi:plastocyanin